MNKLFRQKLRSGPRRLAMTLIACGAAATSAHAAPSNNIVIVPPTDLPELAQHAGDALLLRDTIDGRTLLYVEQGHGSNLATFDVTDPAHVRGVGLVQLNASEPFDFVSPVGRREELIRFRQSLGGALLNFRKDQVPSLEFVQGLTVPGPVTTLDSDGILIAGPAPDNASLREYQVVDTAKSDLNRKFDVKQVHSEVTNADTGTTFLLAQNGLYVIRRPAAEWDKKQRDQAWFEQHIGGGS